MSSHYTEYLTGLGPNSLPKDLKALKKELQYIPTQYRDFIDRVVDTAYAMGAHCASKQHVRVQVTGLGPKSMFRNKT